MTYSTRTLNDVLKINYPDDKLIDFKLHHYEHLELNKFDLKNLDDFPDYRSHFASFAEQGLAYTIIISGKISGVFGVFELWPGVYEFWMVPGKDLKKNTIAFHRRALAFFDYFWANTKPNRVQFTVCSLNFHADRWAKRCYFEREAVLKKYGPDGSDYFMYARIS